MPNPNSPKLCQSFWGRECKEPATVTLVAKDGGYFGDLCDECADDLEKHMNRQQRLHKEGEKGNVTDADF